MKINYVGMETELTASQSRSTERGSEEPTTILTLKKVLFVLALTFNLMSAIRITRKEILGIDQGAKYSNIYLLKTDENIFSVNFANSGYQVKLRICKDSDFSKATKDTKAVQTKSGLQGKNCKGKKNVY